VKFLAACLALALSLAVQTVLGRLWPSSYRYLDVMLIPLVWYGIVGSQRSAMLFGCAAGLFQDGWFQVGVFGLNGFKKTCLGWLLGGLGARFDLNGVAGRFLGGCSLSLLDTAMDFFLRRLMDQRIADLRWWEIGVRALVAGVLVLLVFSLLERMQEGRRNRRLT